jgi:hypothetical protein
LHLGAEKLVIIAFVESLFQHKVNIYL